MLACNDILSFCRTCGGIAYTEMRSHSMSRAASFSKRGPKSAKTVGKQAAVSQNPEGFMSQTAGAKVKDRSAQIQQKAEVANANHCRVVF